MSICHCLSVKKKVSVKNVKILEMSDFGNSDGYKQGTRLLEKTENMRVHRMVIGASVGGYRGV